MLGTPEHPGCLFCIVCAELRRTSCTQGTGIETMEGFMCLMKCNSGYFMMPFLNSSCCSGRVEVCYGCPLCSACPARTSLLTQETWIPLNPFAAGTCAGGWRESGHGGDTSRKEKLTLAVLELDIIFIIQAWLISSGKRKIFIVRWGNAREVNSGEGLDVKGMCVVIHGWQIHGANSKIHGPKRHFCVNHCNPCKQQQERDILKGVFISNVFRLKLRSRCAMARGLRAKL